MNENDSCVIPMTIIKNVSEVCILCIHKSNQKLVSQPSRHNSLGTHIPQSNYSLIPKLFSP